MHGNKKAAFLVYPMFCNYEIALTLATLSMYGKEVVTFALEKNPIQCEEGMRVIPDKTLDEFNIDEFDCILLSGIGGNPDAILYNERYVDFLRQFVSRDDILIASISISPILLAKAGLLHNKKFCVGMYEEDREEFISVFEYENQQRMPIVTDDNVITAIGMAFREFAVEIAHKLAYKCKNDLWGEIKYPINPEDYIFRLTNN